MILTTSAERSLPAFIRACLLFAERAQAEATKHAISLRIETAHFCRVAGSALRARHFLGEVAS